MTNQAVFTVSQLAEYLKVSTDKVYSMASRGDLPVLRVGCSLRFPVKAVEQWMQDRTTQQRN